MTFVVPSSSAFALGGPGSLPNAAKNPGLHRVLANVMSGTGDAVILLIGDSIAEGLGSNFLGVGFVKEMATIMSQALGVPVAQGLSISPVDTISPADARFTLGSGWTLPPALAFGSLGQHNSYGGVGSAFAGAAAAAGTLTFQPPTSDANTYDTYDVYYANTGTLSGFSVNFNGGTNTVISGSTAGIFKATVTGAAVARPTCNFSAPTTSTAFILGVEPRLSTTPRLRISNMGASGASTATWADTTGAALIGPLNVLTNYVTNIGVPLVACIILGINDVGFGVSTATTLASWRSIISTITAAQALAGIVLVSENPFAASFQASNNAQALYPTYVSSQSGFAAQNGYGFIDIFNNLGGNAGFNVLNSISWYNDAIVHPSNNPGLPDWGRMLANGLLAI